MIALIKQCQKELQDWPEDIRGDLADAMSRLELGHTLAMPLSRPMPSIGLGVHELRFRDRSGIYRVIYYLSGKSRIWLLHAFQKKTQKTPQHHIEVAKKKLEGIEL